MAPVATAQKVEYYHLDALGSVRAVTDENGDVIERHDYLPFGEEWNPEPGSQPRQFTGKERDEETGLDYFGARYYEASLARFTSIDTAMMLAENRADPQRWNRYAYVRNNPLRMVDPDGRDSLDLAIGFGQGVAGVAVGAAVGIVTTPLALATDPVGTVSGAVSGLADIGRGLKFTWDYPGEVVDAYVALATSSNDADQRVLGASIGRGTVVAGLILSPLATRAPATEGIYQFRAASGRQYVGQSGNIPVRLPSHVRSGKLPLGEVGNVRTTRIVGGKIAREIAEQRRIDKLGGVANLENVRNPIGPKRRYLLED